MRIATLPAPIRRRPAGLALTLLVHAALLLGWQMARRPALPEPEPPSGQVQWLRLPSPPLAAPAAPTPPPRAQPTPASARRVPALPIATTAPGPATPPADPGAAATAATAAGAASTATPPVPAAGPGVLQRALRDAGTIDRTLRKENNPYIVAPPDSPQLRMRRGMQAAADLAPGKWYEAPKVEELVNNTGDGARRSRVVTGRGTYCVTERATNTSIDMIEKHGKIRLTSCPAHETPAAAQEWRTARD